MSKLTRFLSPKVSDMIMSGDADDPLKTRRREITVVFVDLRGFTGFTETAEPEEVMSVLREYHAELGRAIMAYDGTIEHFAGDGVMILFNDPVPVERPRAAGDPHGASHARVDGGARAAAGKSAASRSASASASRAATRRSARSASRAASTTARSAPSPISPRACAARPATARSSSRRGSSRRRSSRSTRRQSAS